MLARLTVAADGEGPGSIPRGHDGRDRLYWAALTALLVLLAGNLLYPDTSTDAALNLGPARISPLGVFFALTAPFIIVYAWGERRRLSLTAIDLLLPMTMAYIAVRGILAADTLNGVALTAAYAAYVLVLYYGAGVLVQKRPAMKVIMAALVCIALAAIALGLAEFFLERNVLYAEIIKEGLVPPGKGYHRSGSTLGHPLALGLFLVQVAPFFVVFYARSITMARRFFWGAALMLLALALLVTYSKAPWGAAVFLGAAAAAWTLWKKPASRRYVLVLTAAVVIAAASFSAIFHETVYSGTLSKVRKSESTKPRSYMWTRAPSVIAENPVFGVGLWEGAPVVTQVDFIDYGKRQPSAIDNVYLAILVEQGIVGAMLALATLALLFRRALALCLKKGETAGLAIMLTASMSAAMICGLTMDSLMMWPGMIMFWLAAGMLCGLDENSKKKVVSGGIL